jgi:hypothetical protein
MPHRDFDTHRRQAAGERVTFNIRNVDGSDDIFECASDAPGGVMMDVASIGEANRSDQVLAVGKLLDGVLMPESRVRFEKRFRDATNPITLDDAIAIVQWLAQDVYGGRPTTPSSSLPGSASPTGQNSTVAAP